jgi:hypothetical protein
MAQVALVEPLRLERIAAQQAVVVVLTGLTERDPLGVMARGLAVTLTYLDFAFLLARLVMRQSTEE